MSQAHADRNMLFGILALQMDFITRDQLVSAMQAWVFDKTQPLGKIFIKQSALETDTHDLIEALVKKHLAQHGGDVAKSLAAVSAAGQVAEAHDDLEKVTDPDVQASLIHVSPTKHAPHDPYATRPSEVDKPSEPAERFATRPPSVGEVSSSGLRFRILRPHARGGLGEVLVARDEELNREVALKQIQDRHAHDRESQVRFMLEAEITGGLEHPGIVPVYGLGHYPDGRPYYAMRFIRGDSLKDAIERFHKADRAGNRDPGERSLELRSLLGRFVDVCNAIGYAHFRGVVHRDLKPGNIMLGKYGETLVVDWGLAKPLTGPNAKVAQSIEPGEGTLTPSSASMASHTVMGSAMGTPQYMSPEQAAGRLDLLGPASDVYSLGATLYSLLTGQPPIQDTEVGTVLQKVQRGDIPTPRSIKPDLPAPLEAICVKAMAKLPIDRYADTKALADDVEHWLADEPVSAWPEPWTVKTRRWMSRHRTLVTTAASVVIVALAGFAIATVLLEQARAAEEKQRKIAQQERDEKEKARAGEETQRKLAEDNYKLARSAVDRYHTNVSEEVLLHEPGMQPLRKKLLGNAREFYQTFVDKRGKEPGLEQELGKAVFRLARITAEVEDAETEEGKAAERQAIKLHEEAQKIFASLDVKDPDIQSDMAANWQYMGQIYRNIDQPAEAGKAYSQALKLWAVVVEKQPKEERYRAEEARSQLGMGNVYLISRRLDEAQAIYEKALATRKALVESNKKKAEHQRDLAMTLGNLARVHFELGQQEKAAKASADAIAIFEGLVKEAPYISQYQNDLGRALYNRADFYAAEGDTTNAELLYQRAFDICKELVEKHPAVIDFQVKQAEVWTARARMYSAARQKDQALDAAKKAIAIKQKLVDNHQGVISYQNDLARGYNALGNVHQAAGDVANADAAYHDALKILDKLAGNPKAIPQYPADLARTYDRIGDLYFVQDKDEAEEAYKRSRVLWAKLAEDYRDQVEYAVGLSTVDINLGNLIRANGNPKGSLDWFGKALRDVDNLAAAQRNDPTVQGVLRKAHWKRAEALTLLGQHTDALGDWDEALKYTAKADQTWLQLYRAESLARAGEHKQAVEEAGPIGDRAAKSKSAKAGEALFHVACVYALASGAASGDVKMTPDQRTSMRDQYAEKALDALEKARSGGFFKLPENVEKLNSQDLNPIRDTPRFGKLKELIKSK